jgi:hypothetical protein
MRLELPDAHGKLQTVVLEHEHNQIGPNVRTNQTENSVVNDCVQNVGDRNSGDVQWKI